MKGKWKWKESGASGQPESQPWQNPTGLAAAVARCRVDFCCVCKVMELVCIDFVVAGGESEGSVAQVDCQGKVFSIFRIFIAPTPFAPPGSCCVPRCQSTNCFHFAPLRAF